MTRTENVPAQKRRVGKDPVVAGAILGNISDFLHRATLEVHRTRSKNTSKVALGAPSKLSPSSRATAKRDNERVQVKIYLATHPDDKTNSVPPALCTANSGKAAPHACTYQAITVAPN